MSTFIEIVILFNFSFFFFALDRVVSILFKASILVCFFFAALTGDISDPVNVLFLVLTVSMFMIFCCADRAYTLHFLTRGLMRATFLFLLPCSSALSAGLSSSSLLLFSSSSKLDSETVLLVTVSCCANSVTSLSSDLLTVMTHYY